MVLNRTPDSVHWFCYTQRSYHNDHTRCYCTAPNELHYVYYVCLGCLLLSSYVLCRKEAGMMLHRTPGSVHWSCYT